MARAKTKKTKSLKIGGQEILPGQRKRIQIEVAALFDYTPLTVPIEVIRGEEDGPRMFISAAIHGDEINGVEIIKRLLQRPVLKQIRGTLIAVPVVNVFGYNNKSRYLPDRRDLNRCFPGSKKGSLGAQLAAIFMKEIVSHCTHGLDLHTGAINRANLPQIRACLDDPLTHELAQGFGVPVTLHSKLRDGSLREAARHKGVTTLLYEGGEALRFDESVIKIGLRGCINVMRFIGMLPPAKSSNQKPFRKIFEARSSYWVRAEHSGSFRTLKKLGDHVQQGELLAVISDPFGSELYDVRAESAGIIIGMSTIPLINRGDAMVHIATFNDPQKVREALDLFHGF
jgi:uncharacterized protein